MEAQLHTTHARDLLEHVDAVKNDPDGAFRKKPINGFWTSSWREETRDSDWVEWCRGNDYGNPNTDHWFLLTPRKDARVYVIDSYADLERLIKKYPYVSPRARNIRDWQEVHRYYTSIDFERMSQDYDGLRLTERGNSRLHMSTPLDMNLWDAESTVWFRWCFTDVRELAPEQLASEQ